MGRVRPKTRTRTPLLTFLELEGIETLFYVLMCGVPKFLYHVSRCVVTIRMDIQAVLHFMK